MITISGLGFDTQAVDAGTAPKPFRLSTALLTKGAPSTYVAPYQPAATPGACASPDVMSEFGCLTPKVLAPGSSAVNQVWTCPAGSQPYNAQYCLRTGQQMVVDTALIEAMRAQAAADAAAAAAQAQADADAAAAAAAAQAAADAAAHGQPAPDGTEPSPGMTVTTTTTPDVVPTYVPPKPIPWLKIGAGAIGVGLLVAFLARR